MRLKTMHIDPGETYYLSLDKDLRIQLGSNMPRTRFTASININNAFIRLLDGVT